MFCIETLMRRYTAAWDLELTMTFYCPKYSGTQTSEMETKRAIFATFSRKRDILRSHIHWSVSTVEKYFLGLFFELFFSQGSVRLFRVACFVVFCLRHALFAMELCFLCVSVCVLC